MKTLTRTCTVAGFATLLTAFAGATAAQAATITVPDEGTLLGDGAGVTLSVTFDCDAGWTANVFAEAAQKVQGNRVATGNGFSDTVTCAAGTETVDVALLAAGDFIAFTDDDAVVRVSLFTCDNITCEQVVVAGEVRFEESQ